MGVLPSPNEGLGRVYNVSMATIIRAQKQKLADLKPYRRNPRQGDTDAIAASMQALGQYKPIVVNIGTAAQVQYEILAGNHTAAAARQLGWKSIDTVLVDVDDATAERIMLADNRTSDLATYDHETLLTVLQGIRDLSGTGYTMEEIEALTPPEDITVEQSNKSQEGVNLFHQKKDWEERETRGILLDYDLEGYWKVRDLFDEAVKKSGSKTPAEALLFIIEQVTGEQAPR